MTTVYFAGTEDVSFSYSLDNTPGITGYFIRSQYSRCGLMIKNGGSPYPPTYYLPTPLFGPVSNFWIRCVTAANFAGGSTTRTTENCTFMALLDASGVGRNLVLGTG